MLIALVAVLVLGGLWLVALRPHSGGASAGSAAVTAAPTHAPVASPSAPARTAPTRPSPAAVANRAAAADRSAPLLAELAGGKVVVLLFWNGRSADDKAARDAVRGVDRHAGKVAVHVADIADAGAYGPITRGVKVAQTPTTLVIDAKRHAQVVAGFTDAAELDQAVADALSPTP